MGGIEPMNRTAGATLSAFFVAFASHSVAQEKSSSDLQVAKVSTTQRHDGCTTLRTPGIAESASQYRSYAIDRCSLAVLKPTDVQALITEIGEAYRNFVAANDR